ncbi:efflux RND transporter periplasmic adaptor subunit [Lysobacter sp. CA196]|uniref:efflux RND transporter periplasmic adaptor subunit n=1 Tax=Lysobacter sp. CA196 TaxID=3455606 RepID=UPI003F8D632C
MTRFVRILAVAAASVAVLGAAGAGYWWGQSRTDAQALADPAAQAIERKALYWYDPMVPDQRFEKPGKSPFMDMQLVPKYADGASENGIAIAPGVRQNLGIRTVAATRGRLEVAVRVPGTIGWDLRQERVVSARADSIVERQHIKTPYERVRAGEALVSIVAPAWSTALAESQALGRARSASARTLQSASHERLRALGIPAGTGRGGRMTLTSPIAGVVSEIGIREGQSAGMGALLYRINGTATVWVEAAVPQSGLFGIAAGTPAEVSVDALPGRIFRGEVEALLPQVDVGSRTQRLRIVLNNPQGVLAPGMFAQVALQPSTGDEHPLVPTEALIASDGQMRLILLGEDGAFRPVRVQTGRSSKGMTEVLTGLQGGERVVASGQFLIDSEANLSGALQRLGSDSDASAMAAENAMPPAASMRSGERKPLYWYDPMMPDRHFEQPGKSPYMDMQLVPKYPDEAESPESRP